MSRCLASIALSLGLLTACADTIDGRCNSCPDWSSIDTAGCSEAAAEAGCASGEVMEVSDDRCGLGMPPMTHLVCVYTGCAESVECTRFANP